MLALGEVNDWWCHQLTSQRTLLRLKSHLEHMRWHDRYVVNNQTRTFRPRLLYSVAPHVRLIFLNTIIQFFEARNAITICYISISEKLIWSDAIGYQTKRRSEGELAIICNSIRAPSEWCKRNRDSILLLVFSKFNVINIRRHQTERCESISRLLINVK